MPTLAETRTADRREPDVATPADIQTATGFVVVCRGAFRYGRAQAYAYDHYTTLNDAADAYTEYESGEYGELYPVALMACRFGIPFAALSSWRVTQLVADTRAA